jgi:hypothetical protein
VVVVQRHAVTIEPRPPAAGWSDVAEINPLGRGTRPDVESGAAGADLTRLTEWIEEGQERAQRIR